jgi:hypothetical protein
MSDARPGGTESSRSSGPAAIDTACGRFEGAWKAALSGALRQRIEDYQDRFPILGEHWLRRTINDLASFFRRAGGDTITGSDFPAKETAMVLQRGMLLVVLGALFGGLAGAGAADTKADARLARIRAAKMPKFDKPVLFDTPEADAILAALEVFPPDNPWNQDVSAWPLHPNSRNMVASVGLDKPLRCNTDMGFVLVPPDQPLVNVRIGQYAGESDPGPYPVPDNTPVEGWPVNYRDRGREVTLDDVQRDRFNENGDRHALVVDPVRRMLYEFYQLKKTDGGWQATQASIFDLKTNRLRPAGWTSTDAAGLPIFPAVVRYDELKRGLVEHAMRVTIRKSRQAYTYPARHFASRRADPNLPRMGERLRLRQDFDVSEFSPEARAVLKGLKKYGMFVADNGLEWAISVAPDPRIPSLHAELRKVKGSDFEVVQTPD